MLFPVGNRISAVYSFRMDGILAIALVTILLAPLHFLVLYQFEHLDSAAYLRKVGVIILRLDALDSCGAVVGVYSGQAIYDAVTFKEMRYTFDRIVTPSYRRRIGSDELYLDPGLVYVAHDDALQDGGLEAPGCSKVMRPLTQMRTICICAES